MGVILHYGYMQKQYLSVNPTHVGVIPGLAQNKARTFRVNPTHVGVILESSIQFYQDAIVNPTHVGVILTIILTKMVRM